MADKKAQAAAKPNPRGEVTLPLGGTDYRLRPSYEAIEAIEDATGKSLFELADAARSQALSVKECGIIASQMMKAYARTHEDDPLATTYRAAQPSTLSHMIFEEGPALIQPRLAVALLAALSGGVDAQGEFKAVAKK